MIKSILSLSAFLFSMAAWGHAGPVARCVTLPGDPTPVASITFKYGPSAIVHFKNGDRLGLSDPSSGLGGMNYETVAAFKTHSGPNLDYFLLIHATFYQKTSLGNTERANMEITTPDGALTFNQVRGNACQITYE